MFALRNTISRMAQANNTMVMARRTNVISGPPRNKISGVEMAVHFSAIMVGLCIVPGYVLANIKNYRGRED